MEKRNAIDKKSPLVGLFFLLNKTFSPCYVSLLGVWGALVA